MPLPVTGFPAQPRTALMARLIGDLRSRADTSRVELATGRLVDPALAQSGRVTELFDLERALADLSQRNQILDLAEARADTIQTSLNTLRQIAVDLHSSGITALASEGGVATRTISTAARQALTTAVAALNASFGGRGLFSGDAGGLAIASAEAIMAASVAVLEPGPTGGAAYASLTAEFTMPGALFDTSFYSGGTGDAPASEIADDERIAFAPRGDEQPIRTLLRDITALAAAFDDSNAIPEDARRSLAENAVSGLLNGVDDIATITARVGTAEERMAAVRARHSASETGLTQAFNRLSSRDQFEAAAELTQLESQLQTVYLTTARLANLSLANYLR